MISKLTLFIISAIAIAVLDAKCTTEPIQTTTAALCLNCNGQVTGGKAVEATTISPQTTKQNLYVEYLAVIDAGVYNFFVQLYGSTVSPSVIKSYIQVYFTQLVNGVIF